MKRNYTPILYVLTSSIWLGISVSLLLPFIINQPILSILAFIFGMLAFAVSIAYIRLVIRYLK